MDILDNRSTIDPAVACLVTIAYFHGIPADGEQLRHDAGKGSAGFGETEIVRAAKILGLKARAVDLRRTRLAQAPLPALMIDAGGRHFILAQVRADGRAVVQEGGATETAIIALNEVLERTSGRAVLFTARAAHLEESNLFGFSWFIPALIKYKKFFLEVLWVSIVLQLLGLIPPLMFQVVMDKVLVNRALSTLNAICFALIVTAVFEPLLTALRGYLLAHTTTRIDAELGGRLFRHLLNLPLTYFNVRRVGDSITRVRELESIRNFLTGQALTTTVDLLLSIAVIGVMFIYSRQLTWIVIASLPAYALVSITFTPVLKRSLNAKFARYSDSQSLLVETVSGIETVKALAVEPQFVHRWDQQLASYVGSAFRVVSLASVGQQLIQFVGKLVTAVTLFVGTRLVIDGHLTVGELIAFNMLSQRVATPVLRLAQFWQDFQQVGLAMQRLGDILNTKAELCLSREAPPPMRGAIWFEEVYFRYEPDRPLALAGVSFDIKPGQVVGIVGRSGSGKSTVAKLLQRLYVPERGRILVDGHDLALADPSWLRRQIGVVLQENVLFGRSIRANIALADPALPLSRVISAAKSAGIHDWIMELPKGYDSMVGDQGTGLSGGQKQRIAIARAIAADPKILIFDEATSALDYETERVIQANMHLICRGRTVIIIAHRLSAVREADFIIALDGGSIVEMDAHEELLARKGYYARLVALQGT